MEMSLSDAAAITLAAYAALLSSWNFYAARRDGRKKQGSVTGQDPSKEELRETEPRKNEPHKDELKLRILQAGRFTVSAGQGDGSQHALLLIHLQAEVVNHRLTESAVTIKSAQLDGVQVEQEQSSMWLGIQRRPVMDQKIIIGADGAQYFTVTLALLTAQATSAVTDLSQGSIVFEDTFLGELPAVAFKANRNQG